MDMEVTAPIPMAVTQQASAELNMAMDGLNLNQTAPTMAHPMDADVPDTGDAPTDEVVMAGDEGVAVVRTTTDNASTDVTKDVAEDEPMDAEEPEGDDDDDNMTERPSGFIAYPSITKPSDLMKRLMYRFSRTADAEGGGAAAADVSGSVGGASVRFVGVCKLHGCNAAIVLRRDGALQIQSRNRILKPGKVDHCGIARLLAPHEVRLKALMEKARERAGAPDGTMVALFGEWCGPGVQRHVAISNLATHRFFGFDLLVGNEWQPLSVVKETKDVEANVYSVMDYSPLYELEIDPSAPEKWLDLAMEMTRQVDVQCPVSLALGLEGPGEGIVWRPADDAPHDMRNDVRMRFKTKGDRHMGLGEKPKAPVKVVKGPPDELSTLITKGRCMQGLEWVKEMYSDKMENMKPQEVVFRASGWVVGDIWKEEQDELAKLMVTSDKQLNKVLMNTIKDKVHTAMMETAGSA